MRQEVSVSGRRFPGQASSELLWCHTQQVGGNASFFDFVSGPSSDSSVGDCPSLEAERQAPGWGKHGAR